MATTSCWLGATATIKSAGGGGDNVLAGGRGRDLFLYYASVDNGQDTITDFDSADDTILPDGFHGPGAKVRTVNGSTVLILADHGRIAILGPTRLDDDDLAFR